MADTQQPYARLYLSVAGVADKCGVTPLTVWRWVRDRRFSDCARTERGWWLVPEDQVNAFLASGRRCPARQEERHV